METEFRVIEYRATDVRYKTPMKTNQEFFDYVEFLKADLSDGAPLKIAVSSWIDGVFEDCWVNTVDRLKKGLVL